LAESSSVRSSHCVLAVSGALSALVITKRESEQARSERMGFCLSPWRRSRSACPQTARRARRRAAEGGCRPQSGRRSGQCSKARSVRGCPAFAGRSVRLRRKSARTRNPRRCCG
jgi:hypothetical protein